MVLKKLLIFTFLIFVHLLILLKIQFIAWPEMLSYPYLLERGYLIYKDIINPYPPLLPFLLQIYYKIIGLNLFSLKLFTLVLIVLTDILLFLVVKKIFNFRQAILTLAIFILLQSSLEGNGLWFDLAISPLLIISYYLSYKIIKSPHNRLVLIFLVGLTLGLAFLVKQTSGFIILSLAFLFRRKITAFLTYSLAVLTPLALVSLIMLRSGIYNDYLFWVYKYPFEHIRSPGFLLYPTIKQSAVLILLLIPPACTILRYKNDSRISPILFLFFPLLLFAFPRFSYFHLQPVLAFISISAAYALQKLVKEKKLIIAAGYLSAVLLIFVYFFLKLANQEPRFFDKNTLKIASVLHNKLSGKGYIYFYNLSSEYFVMADLLPAKPWVDTFPWYLEVNGLQDKIVSKLKQDNIEYVVSRDFGKEGRYIPGSYRPSEINQYIQTNFIPYEKITNDIVILQRVY